MARLPPDQAFPNAAPAGKRPVEEVLGFLGRFFGDPAHVQVEAAGGLLLQREALTGETPGYRPQGLQVLSQVPRPVGLEILAR